MRAQIAIGLITTLAFAPSVAAKGKAHHWQTSPHHFSALVGTTYTKECGNAFTVGIDYEYRVTDFLGLGFVAEYAFEDLDAYTYLLVADLHITTNFIAQIGPGVEFHGSHKMEVVRLGFLYEFEVSGVSVSPQLHYDYHRNHKSAVVAGIAIGMSF
ncbi:conserved exported hypothetical protein [Alteromonas sp. 38]|uniref:hypothetical protein n=1 Tax=Alteromonas TaxID=226 RepID=UPI0012F21FDC|nr:MULTISPECIES: hypothetical protein [Alteromonas]CAD5272264.1 conserved exported hypothetical protein [Alteromonas sp. 154]VXB51481.1 conserved exported hypothetical protein [Alteromonas sp. 38]